MCAGQSGVGRSKKRLVRAYTDGQLEDADSKSSEDEQRPPKAKLVD